MIFINRHIYENHILVKTDKSTFNNISVAIQCIQYSIKNGRCRMTDDNRLIKEAVFNRIIGFQGKRQYRACRVVLSLENVLITSYPISLEK
jgi:hypothetical protein